MVPSASIIRQIAAVVVVLAVAFGAPSAARAEHWITTGNMCMDGDSVHVSTINGERYVIFKQHLCNRSNDPIRWWAVADADCRAATASKPVSLYVYYASRREWVSVMDMDGMFSVDNPAVPDDDAYANAGVACNWAHPGFL